MALQVSTLASNFEAGLKRRIQNLVEQSEVFLPEKAQMALRGVDEAYLKFKSTADNFTQFAFELVSDGIIKKLPTAHNRLSHMCLGYAYYKVGNKDFLVPHSLKFPLKGALFKYDALAQRAISQSMMLDAALSSVASTTIEKIQIRSVSYQDFGECFAALSLFPDANATRVATDDEKLSILLNEIEQRLFAARANSLKTASNPEASDAQPSDYMLVLVDLDSDISSELVLRLNKFLFSEVCARSGIHFLACCHHDSFSPKISPELQVSVGRQKDSTAQYQTKSSDVDSAHEGYTRFYVPLDARKRVEYIGSLINRVETVESRSFIQTEEEWFKESSIDGLTVPIGRSNGKKFDLLIGNGTTNYNILIGGGVGSGKSVLLHNIILGIATNYSVDDCELLLLDYKEGTEFKPYERLPHAKILATSSEPEFGVRMLEFVELEIKRRGNLFKKAGVSNISDYRRTTVGKMPRWVIVIDEFQKLLADQRSSRRAEALLDSLVRTGRSFGIHFVLATQSLFDVNLSIATQSNLSVRICLRISEIDASKILSMDNLVPAGFQRPGQAVFNDNNGQLGNNTEIIVPYIGGDLQSSTLDRLAQILPVVNDAIRFEGEKFSLIDLKKIDKIGGRSAGLSFGSTLDVQGTPHVVPVNPQNIDPILIVGSSEEKRKSLLSSLMYQIEALKRFGSVSIIDLEPQMDIDPQSSHYQKVRFVRGLSAADEELSRLLNEKSSKDGEVSVVVFLGISKNKQLRKREVDQDTFEETDHPVKRKMFECVKRGGEVGILPVIVIDRYASFPTIFESMDFSKQVQLEDFPFRIFLDQSAELSNDGLKVTDVGCIVQDVHNGSLEPIILYEAMEGD